ncbi:MFS general substrate transporter [Aulographum hederae CBS 113979]|uniref:MFS general substrate transporter n=1 Tax=Aulographum hederae CBS 113979 TaxID=1176131 RepID=A0A6G1GZP3_9PEZI|nr:MFS general substrate transporter [Aulographum hederae CBS 113979]
MYSPKTTEERALDKAVNLKLDCVVLVVCATNFFVQGIDKSNIGNAATTATFESDAHLGPNDISDSVSLLAITFVTLQPVSTALARRFGPKYWIPFLMVCWGAISMAHAGIHNRATLIALRLLLGAFEAGFVPSCFYYLSTIYPHYMVGFRLGLFVGMFSIAGAFSGAIAYAIFHIKSNLKDWQLLFLIEGGVTIIMAVVSLAVLPERLSSAWFLNEKERVHAVYRMHVDNPNVDARGNFVADKLEVSKENILDAVKDWRKLLVVVCNICSVLPASVFAVFLPLIVEGMGYEGQQANLMSVPPFVVGAFGVYLFTYLSDRHRERSLIIVLSMLLSTLGFIVLVATPSNPSASENKLRYAFLHFCLAGAGASGSLVAAWLIDNTPDRAVRSVVIGINGWSNLAGVISGQLFRKQYAPGYRMPLGVTLAIVIVGMLGFVGVRMQFVKENGRRKREMATWDDERLDRELEDVGKRGDQKITFRYRY